MMFHLFDFLFKDVPINFETHMTTACGDRVTRVSPASKAAESDAPIKKT